MFCENCGNKVDDNVNNCPNCGAAINSVDNQVVQNNPNHGKKTMKIIIIVILIPVVIVVAIAFIGVIFASLIWPTVKTNINASLCSNIEITECEKSEDDTYSCSYESSSGEKEVLTCTYDSLKK